MTALRNLSDFQGFWDIGRVSPRTGKISEIEEPLLFSPISPEPAKHFGELGAGGFGSVEALAVFKVVVVAFEF